MCICVSSVPVQEFTKSFTFILLNYLCDRTWNQNKHAYVELSIFYLIIIFF